MRGGGGFQFSQEKKQAATLLSFRTKYAIHPSFLKMYRKFVVSGASEEKNVLRFKGQNR